MNRVLLAALFLFAFLICNNTKAQTIKWYDEAWKKTEKLIKEDGLTRDAMTEIRKIYARAKKENNSAQWIKALIYEINTGYSITEEHDAKAIASLEKEIQAAQSNTPVRALLQSLLADAMLQYYLEHLYEIQNRPTLPESEITFNIWSKEDFKRNIQNLYKASLEDKKALQQIAVQTYQPLLIKGNKGNTRPTLYDLLAYRAIDFATAAIFTDQRAASYRNPENDSLLFLPAAYFEELSLDSMFSSNHQLNALQILQELIRFHREDKNEEALLAADIYRLEFAFNHATHEKKTNYYRQALQQLLEKYQNAPSVAQAGYLLAQSYANFAATYQFKIKYSNEIENPRYYYQKARSIIKVFSDLQPQNEGIVNCRNLLFSIEEKTLTLQTEQVNLPETPLRALVTYRNTDSLYFRILPVPNHPTHQPISDYWDSVYWAKLVQQTPLLSFSHAMPAIDDYQTHQTEIMIPALPIGSYVLLSGIQPDFSLPYNLMAANLFHVSNIAWMQNGNDYFILHRNTGQPLTGASVTTYYQEYDVRTNQFFNQKGVTNLAEEKGSIRIPNEKPDRSFRLEIKYQNDSLWLPAQQYFHNYTYEYSGVTEEKKTNCFLFTDRAIYRPGQPIYFKALMTEKIGNNRSTPGQAITTVFFLRDANYQIVDSLTLTTNSYGSASGKFIIPKDRLLGQYSISESRTQQSAMLSVEAYKRPQFEIEIQAADPNILMHESTTVIGKAMSYAGYPVVDARVQYKVTRSIAHRFQHFYDPGRWPSRKTYVIAAGTTRTNEQGNFTCVFTTSSDPTLQDYFNPIYEYEIECEITDEKGETVSGSTVLKTAFQNINLSLQNPVGEKIISDSIGSISVYTQNKMDQPVSLPFQLRISSLETPQRLIRQRFWDEPDQFIIEEKEYLKNFPFDEYKAESKKENWKRKNIVVQYEDTTTASGMKGLRKLKLPRGWYLIEAVVYNGKDSVVEQTYVEISSRIQDPSLLPAYISQHKNKTTARPGTKIDLGYYSSCSKFYLISSQTDAVGKTIHQTQQRSQGVYPQTISIPNSFSGYLQYQWAFIQNNRLHKCTHEIEVPMEDKDLSIQATSYRNKTNPGNQEEWTVTIRPGNAELLTSMYDISLDAFQPNNWLIPEIDPLQKFIADWNGSDFAATFSQSQSFIPQLYFYPRSEDDKLIPLEIQRRYMYDLGRPQIMMSATPNDGMKKNKTAVADESEKQIKEPEKIKVRKDFAETAFFYPQQETDSNGVATIRFVMPESLTTWKWQVLAHNEKLAFGKFMATIQSAKTFMVRTQAPRFLRTGDVLQMKASLVNMSEQKIEGNCILELTDAESGKKLDAIFNNNKALQQFSIESGKQTTLSYSFKIPDHYTGAINAKVIARQSAKDLQGNFAGDGEEITIPVLPNQLLITETLPIEIKKNGIENFSMEGLVNSDTRQALSSQNYSVEIITHPIWQTALALPYVASGNPTQSDDLFSMLFSQLLGNHIVDQYPNVYQEIIERMPKDTASISSRLEAHETYKEILLQETPWMQEAETEAASIKRLARYYDTAKQNELIEKLILSLKELQKPSGGFPWFKEGKEDLMITLNILNGIGQIYSLNTLSDALKNSLSRIYLPAIQYADSLMLEQYRSRNASVDKRKYFMPDERMIDYLFARSYFTSVKLGADKQKAHRYWLKWVQSKRIYYSMDAQAKLALVWHRLNKKKTALRCLETVRQNAVQQTEEGMYWKENAEPYRVQSGVGSQALMIEAFQEIQPDESILQQLNKWLIRQKQTHLWSDAHSTTAACFALLKTISTKDFSKGNLLIIAGNDSLRNKEDLTYHGFVTKSWNKEAIYPALGKLKVVASDYKILSKHPLWGAAYWQYLAPPEAVQNGGSGLSLTKKYFLKKQGVTTDSLMPILNNTPVRAGDKIYVQLQMDIQRDLGYLHLKDMKPACAESGKARSGYAYHYGMSYYTMVQDAGVHFFFDQVAKGRYLFDYEFTVAHPGAFSGGIATLQSLYNPAIRSHSGVQSLTVQP
ncbi:MAG: hypothetical protein KGP35_09245 [Bacteroidetes bacterium]|nr:hypothetical protein [Bacteroidota bacterium]